VSPIVVKHLFDLASFSYNRFKLYKNNLFQPQISKNNIKVANNSFKLPQLTKTKDILVLRFISIFTAVQCKNNRLKNN